MPGRTDHPGAWIIGAVVAAVGVPSAIGWVVDQIQKSSGLLIVESKDGVALAAGAYSLSYWFLYAVAVIIVIAVAAVLIDLIYLRRLGQDSRRTATDTRLSYDNLCDSIARVVNHLYNPSNPTREPPPRITFKSIRCQFDVAANGDTTVVQRYEVASGADPAWFWKVRLEFDSYAQQMSVLEDIEFRVEALTPGTTLEAVPFDNRGTERSIALFFLPEIAPQSARSFEVRFKWKGWFGELFAMRDTNWTWSYQSADPNDVADVTFIFNFSRQCGSIICENVKPATVGESLALRTTADRLTWEYRNPTAPVGRLNWLLRFRRP